MTDERNGPARDAAAIRAIQENPGDYFRLWTDPGMDELVARHMDEVVRERISIWRRILDYLKGSGESVELPND